MRMKHLKSKILELPDEWQVTKVLIETVNKHGYSQKIEFDIKKNDITIKSKTNEKNNQGS
jgi:hypothetical protein